MRDGDSFDKLILRQNYELVCLIHINSVMVSHMRDMVKQCIFSYNGFLHNKIMSLCVFAAAKRCYY
jgi:hypothetical protein